PDDQRAPRRRISQHSTSGAIWLLRQLRVSRGDGSGGPRGRRGVRRRAGRAGRRPGRNAARDAVGALGVTVRTVVVVLRRVAQIGAEDDLALLSLRPVDYCREHEAGDEEPPDMRGYEDPGAEGHEDAPPKHIAILPEPSARSIEASPQGRGGM